MLFLIPNQANNTFLNHNQSSNEHSSIFLHQKQSNNKPSFWIRSRQISNECLFLTRRSLAISTGSTLPKKLFHRSPVTMHPYLHGIPLKDPQLQTQVQLHLARCPQLLQLTATLIQLCQHTCRTHNDAAKSVLSCASTRYRQHFMHCSWLDWLLHTTPAACWDHFHSTRTQ